jgi:hypothetical protein
VSASWLAGPQCWVVWYAVASSASFDQPIIATFSANLTTWLRDVKVFDPYRENAYGVFVHKPGSPDRIRAEMPPTPPERPGNCY